MELTIIRCSIPSTRATDILQVAAGQHEILSKLPIGAPDAVPKKTWRKKKNTLNARGLTANEVATIDQATVVKAAKKAVREEAKKAAFKRGREGQDQGREGPQSGEDTTVVVRGDNSDEGPPPSTAPPALGRGKRARAHTARYEDAVNAGELPESQHGALGRPRKR